MKSFNSGEIAFHCAIGRGGCGHKFKSEVYETSELESRTWHPFEHEAVCPVCEMQARQASWEVAQWKAIYDHGAPGPKSRAGRLAVSEANRARDPESYDISRFNAISHGMSAEVAKYYPARPGSYADCEFCEYLTNGCRTEMRHCAKRTELFVQFHLAQEEGDGRLLGKLMASTQAGLAAITSDMIRSIAQRGVDIERPEYSFTKEGELRIARYVDDEGVERVITKVEANPLLPQLINFVQKNNITLGDMNLTPAAAEDEARFNGYMSSTDEDQDSLEDARRMSRLQIETLQKLIGGEGVTIEGAGRVIDSGVGSAAVVDDDGEEV